MRKRASRDVGFCCIEVRVRDQVTSEIVSAEAFAAGASGLEERALGSDVTLLVLYAPAVDADAVHRAVSAIRAARVGDICRVEPRDWSQDWKLGLRPLEIGERLVVRPSFVEHALRPGQRELVIDPGQAFGTGGHASTSLALAWVEASAGSGDLSSSSRVLDVGTGTGVLALAALLLGARRAVGFDLDPDSGSAASEWARYNGLADRFEIFVGPIEALRAPPFDWVLANLLKRELLPIAAEIATVLAPGGRAVFSGLLAAERVEVLEALAQVGLTPLGERSFVDANRDAWISLFMTRA